jgi:uncharacterized protein
VITLIDTGRFFLRILAELLPTFFLATYVAELISEALSTTIVSRTLGSGKGNLAGRLLAPLAGWATPFCFCGSVPIVGAMLRARIPLGTSITFLISSPLIDIASTILLATFFGPTVAAMFVVFSMLISFVAGYLVGWIAPDGVRYDALSHTAPIAGGSGAATWGDRHRVALKETLWFLRKTFLYIVLAAGVAALIHGYLPEAWVSNLSTRGILLDVPLAVLLGVPVYGSAALIIPIGVSLLNKGVPIGILMAFMMASVGFSLPEGIMLSRFFKPRLVAAFFATVAVAITLVGYVSNMGLN